MPDAVDYVRCAESHARLIAAGLPLMPSLGARASVTPAGFGLNRPKAFR